MRNLKIIQLITFLIASTYCFSQEYSEWTAWKSLGEDFKFRYKCKFKSYNDTYTTYFEFERTDAISQDIEKKYGHIILYIDGYDKPVKKSIFFNDSDRRDKVWHPLPFSPCNEGLTYTYVTGFSKYSNASSILKSEKRVDDCEEVINQLGAYTGSDIAKDAFKTGENVSGFFDDEISSFIAKYSKSSAALFKIVSSKAFGVVTGLLDSDNMGTPMDAYENAHERAKGHVYILEKHFTELGKLNSADKSMYYSSEKKRYIIKSIKLSQQELKNELKNMDLALKSIGTEMIYKNNDCRKKAFDQYHACFKYNAEVLLSIKGE